MENKITKLVSQFALLALLAWIVASALGKRNLVAIRHRPQGKRMNRNSQVWNQSPVAAPEASAGFVFGPGAVMYPGEA